MSGPKLTRILSKPRGKASNARITDRFSEGVVITPVGKEQYNYKLEQGEPFTRDEIAPPIVSAAEAGFEQSTRKAGPVAGYINDMIKAGATKEELEWLGFRPDDMPGAKGQNRQVTREEIQDQLDFNRLTIVEENWTKGQEVFAGDRVVDQYADVKFQGYTSGMPMDNQFNSVYTLDRDLVGEFTNTGHFSTTNPLFHTRGGRYYEQSLDKSFHNVEEVQSDLHQRGNKHGYYDERDFKESFDYYVDEGLQNFVGMESKQVLGYDVVKGDLTKVRVPIVEPRALEMQFKYSLSNLIKYGDKAGAVVDEGMLAWFNIFMGKDREVVITPTARQGYFKQGMDNLREATKDQPVFKSLYDYFSLVQQNRRTISAYDANGNLMSYADAKMQAPDVYEQLNILREKFAQEITKYNEMALNQGDFTKFPDTPEVVDMSKEDMQQFLQENGTVGFNRLRESTFTNTDRLIKNHKDPYRKDKYDKIYRVSKGKQLTSDKQYNAPDAPFKDTAWVQAAVRYEIAKALMLGRDGIMISSSDLPKDLYHKKWVTKEAKVRFREDRDGEVLFEVQFRREGKGDLITPQKDVGLFKKNGIYTEDEFAKTFGEEVYNRAARTYRSKGNVGEVDFELDGRKTYDEGSYEETYDRAIPNYMRKFFDKYGIKVEKITKTKNGIDKYELERRYGTGYNNQSVEIAKEVYLFRNPGFNGTEEELAKASYPISADFRWGDKAQLIFDWVQEGALPKELVYVKAKYSYNRAQFNDAIRKDFEKNGVKLMSVGGITAASGAAAVTIGAETELPDGEYEHPDTGVKVIIENGVVKEML